MILMSLQLPVIGQLICSAGAARLFSWTGEELGGECIFKKGRLA